MVESYFHAIKRHLTKDLPIYRWLRDCWSDVTQPEEEVEEEEEEEEEEVVGGYD